MSDTGLLTITRWVCDGLRLVAVLLLPSAIDAAIAWPLPSRIPVAVAMNWGFSATLSLGTLVYALAALTLHTRLLH